MEWNRNKERNKQIRQLRADGKSIREITELLECPKSMVSYHCRGTTPLPPKQGDGGKAGRLAGQRKWQKKIDRVRNEATRQWPILKHDPQFMAFLGLYWGEGFKANRGVLGISNNDPYIVKIIADYLGQFTAKRPVARITYYPLHNQIECTKFWQKLLPGIKIISKENTDPRSKEIWCDRCKYGRCHLSFSDYTLYWKIITWIDMWRDEIKGCTTRIELAKP